MCRQHRVSHQKAPALVTELFRPWCTNQCLSNRMWYVGGSRPGGAQVGRFSSWGKVVPKGFFAESAYFSLIYRLPPINNLIIIMGVTLISTFYR